MKKKNLKYEGHILTEESVVMIPQEGVPLTVLSSNRRIFTRIRKLLKEKEFQKAIVEADRVASLKAKGVVIKGNNVFFKGKKIPKSLSKYIIRLTEEGRNTAVFTKFWKRLSENPSKDSREELFDFMQHNQIPLTSDGCIICYKKVRDDYKDCHSGTFDNSVGAIVKMKREKVDADRTVSCSSGLHAADWRYASDFQCGGRLMLIKINPKNVVSVPLDYDAQKMRVCEYEVVAEHTNEKELKDTIYLADKGEKVEAEGKIVKVDNKGRISIAKSLIEKLGCTRDGKIRVLGNVDHAILVARKGWERRKEISSDLEEGSRYKIDNKGGIRFSAKKALSQWVKPKKKYNVRLCGAYIEIR